MKVVKNTANEIKFCKHCKVYVTSEDYCENNNINYKKCKNYK
ncbi:MAG: hypothetical protein P8L33_03195 [Gammaproteobacteria bacterium]|nr:hypothetical protein [Gammaproteobacteria bacterium]